MLNEAPWDSGWARSGRPRPARGRAGVSAPDPRSTRASWAGASPRQPRARAGPAGVASTPALPRAPPPPECRPGPQPVARLRAGRERRAHEHVASGPPRARGRVEATPAGPARARGRRGDATAGESRVGRGSGAPTPAPRPRRDSTRGAGRTRPAWYARSHATVAAFALRDEAEYLSRRGVVMEARGGRPTPTSRRRSSASRRAGTVTSPPPR